MRVLVVIALISGVAVATDFDCMAPNLLKIAEDSTYEITATGNHAPFLFFLKSTTYEMGSSEHLQLRLSAEEDERIKEYMIVARRPANSVRPVGTFTYGSIGILNTCSGVHPNAATNLGNENVSSISFKWMANNDNISDIIFHATIVDQENRIFTGIKSVLVKIIRDDEEEDDSDMDDETEDGMHDGADEMEDEKENPDEEEEDEVDGPETTTTPDPDEDPNNYERDEEERSHRDEEGEAQDQAEEEKEREEPGDEDGDPWDGQLDDEVRKQEEEQAMREELEQQEEMGSEMNTQMEEEEEEERLLQIENERIEGELLRAALAEEARKMLEWEMKDLEKWLKGGKESDEEEDPEEPEDTESVEESLESVEDPPEESSEESSEETSEEKQKGVIGGSGTVLHSIVLLTISLTAWLFL